ncbi:MAG TPA: CpsB/CapC family capsule biosynthesis tyrosine phosphatase [Spirochaetia bacterium]|nr:CpsB/CapC family capsule biosynthesis tyrosine phosphatase [Spirochaetia bacterium]
MIDFHTHLLPNFDDGAGFPEEALAIARHALAEGTGAALLTPHYLKGRYTPSRSKILAATARLRQDLAAANIDFAVYPGAEVLAFPGLPDAVAKGEITTVNDNGKYLLVELPFLDFPSFVPGELTRLLAAGVIPVLAHPERCLPLDLERLYGLLEQGVLLQLNAGSINGDFGQEVQKSARGFLDRGWIHFLGSDTHSLYSRPPGLTRAAEEVARLAGADLAGAVTDTYPQLALAGQPVPRHPVSPP